MRVSSRFSVGVATVAVSLLAVGQTANAATILVFGQTDLAQLFSGTAVGNSTSLSATDMSVAITAGDDDLAPFPKLAFFTFNATSTGAAVVSVSNDVTQNFSGSFSFRSAAGGGGTNYLSGTFADQTFGSGTGLTMTASDADPTESVSFASEVIPPGDLGQFRSVNLSLSNVTPAVNVTGNPQTLRSFTANAAGNFSANVRVPEPATLVLFGAGLLALAARRRKAQ